MSDETHVRRQAVTIKGGLKYDILTIRGNLVSIGVRIRDLAHEVDMLSRIVESLLQEMD